MNQTVGIQVDIRENASTAAPKIVEQLNNIGEAGEESAEKIQKAFEQLFLANQLDKFQQKLEKTMDKISRRQADETEKVSRRETTRTTEGGGRALLSTGQFIGRTGSQVASLGSTGNVMEAGPGVLSSMTGMLAKAGPVGIGIAAVAAIAAGTGIIIDQLSKQYEPFVSTLMDTTAALGDLSDSAKQNSLTFRENLQEAATAASKFGYSIEQGLEVYGQLAHGGVGSTAARVRMEQELAYARGYGITNLAGLSQAQIMAQRYGQGNVLGLAAGGVGIAGIGAGRYEEYLQSMMSVFQEGISKGVVRGFDEISATMNFFSGIGETWKGQLGVNKIAQLNASMGQATNLQKETDVLMYRAAKSLVGGGDYIEVMKMMEKGISSPGMLKAVGEQLEQLTGGNRADMIELLKSTFGLSYTDTESLYKALKDKDFDKARAVSKKAPTAVSTELDLVKAENELRMEIITLGENTIEAKEALVSSANKVVNAIEEAVGADLAGQRRRSEAEDYRIHHDTAYPEYLRKQSGASDVGFITLLTQTGLDYSLRKVGRDPKYASYLSSSEQVTSLLESMPSSLKQDLAGKDQSKLYRLIRSIGNRNVKVEPEELTEFAPKFKALLSDLLKELNAAVKENTRALREPTIINYQERGGVE